MYFLGVYKHDLGTYTHQLRDADTITPGRAGLIRGPCAVHGDIVCRFRTAPRVGGGKIAEFL